MRPCDISSKYSIDPVKKMFSEMLYRNQRFYKNYNYVVTQ